MAVDSIILGISVQLWYDESIPLEEMYSVDTQLSSCKSSGDHLQDGKVAFLYTVVVLQYCRLSMMSNDVC